MTLVISAANGIIRKKNSQENEEVDDEKETASNVKEWQRIKNIKHRYEKQMHAGEIGMTQRKVLKKRVNEHHSLASYILKNKTNRKKRPIHRTDAKIKAENNQN